MTDSTRLQRRTMIVLVLTQIIGTVGVGVAPTIGVLLAGEVTDDEAWAGLARTASTLGAALLGLPLGNLAAHLGRRAALATGWWIAAAGAALLVAAAQHSLLGPLFVGLLLIGGGSAAALQARFAATDLAPPHAKGRSLALVVWFGTIGSVLGPNLGVPGEALGRGTGLTTYAGAFAIAAACLGLAGLTVFVWLRPDPLRVLAATAPDPTVPVTTGPAASGLPTSRSPRRVRLILAELRDNRRARYAVTAILTAQVVMVAVMTMTPVHIAHHGGSVALVGLTISLHVLGMYALAPVVGLAADRFGHRPVIAAGIGLLLASLVIAAVAPDDAVWLVVSLVLLGVGWSFVNVAASALFAGVVAPPNRASAQGGVDALSNLCAAVAAFASGPIMAATSFAVLAVLAIVALVPLAVLTARRSVAA